jgi:hypothetical protein
LLRPPGPAAQRLCLSRPPAGVLLFRRGIGQRLFQSGHFGLGLLQGFQGCGQLAFGSADLAHCRIDQRLRQTNGFGQLRRRCGALGQALLHQLQLRGKAAPVLFGDQLTQLHRQQGHGRFRGHGRLRGAAGAGLLHCCTDDARHVGLAQCRCVGMGCFRFGRGAVALACGIGQQFLDLAVDLLDALQWHRAKARSSFGGSLGACRRRESESQRRGAGGSNGSHAESVSSVESGGASPLLASACR